MAEVTNINEEVVSETEVFVKEKKHPIRDFFVNHPAITTIAVGIIAGLGGYAVGSAMCEDDSVDIDYDQEAGTLTITDATTETIE